MWFTTRLAQVSLSTDQNLKLGAMKVTKKVAKAQSSGMVMHYHVETKKQNKHGYLSWPFVDYLHGNIIVNLSSWVNPVLKKG